MAQSGTESIEIAATPQKILEVVSDVDSYPDWMPAFKLARILEKDEQGRPTRAEFEVDARLKVVDYTLEYAYPQDGIEWKSVGGSVKQIDGAYSLQPKGDNTLVTYRYAIDPGFSVPGFLLKQGVKLMVSTALNDLKKRAES